MKLFKNEVGRPSNETIAKRKKIKIIIASVIIGVIALSGIYIYQNFINIPVIEAGELNATPSKNKFSVENKGNNCYTIYAPTNAKNWRVQVYYKKKSASYYGSNKISSLSTNHYNDNVKTQSICLKKQKNNYETYRILVKWTTGANDRAYSSVSIRNWKPVGWYHNAVTGWAYVDLNVDWSKTNSSSSSSSSSNSSSSSSSNSSSSTAADVKEITYSLSGVNGGLTVNGKYYAKNTSVTEKTIGNNWVFGNSNGKTQINVTFQFPKKFYTAEFYPVHPVTKQKKNERRYQTFRVVSYNKSGKELSKTGLIEIKGSSHSQKITISSNVYYIRVFVYSANLDWNKTTSQGMLTLLDKKIWTTPAPSITTTTTGERIKNNNGYLWSSFTTYGKKTVTFTVNNPNNIQLYGRWMTYPTYEATKPGYIDSKCTSISKNYTTKPTLELSASYPKRKGVYKVFADKASCDKNSGETISSTVWYENTKTYTTSDGFIEIKNLQGGSNNKILKAIKNKKQITDMCYEYSLAYGSMILRNTSTFPKIDDNKTFGAYGAKPNTKKATGANLIAIIKSQINKGIPVMIHTMHLKQHWVLVVGYKANASNNDIANNIGDYLHIIDPYGRNNSNTIGIGTLNDSIWYEIKQSLHSDSRYMSWTSASNATA